MEIFSSIFKNEKAFLSTNYFSEQVFLDGQRLKGTVLDTLRIKKNNQKGVAEFKAEKADGMRDGQRKML